LGVFLVIFPAFCWWLSPGKKLTREEVDALIVKTDKNLTMPEADRSDLPARLRAWGYADDGQSLYMVNLIQFKNPIEPWPGQDIKPASPEATDDVYVHATAGMAVPKGIWPMTRVNVQGMGDTGKSNLYGFYPGFDDFKQENINYYRSRRVCLELLSSPEYLKVRLYKFAGTKPFAIPTGGGLILPDLRLALGIIFLVVFLTVGWIRSARAGHHSSSQRLGPTSSRLGQSAPGPKLRAGHQLYQRWPKEDGFQIEARWESMENLVRHLRSNIYKEILLLVELSTAPPIVEVFTGLESRGLDLVKTARTPSN
jgi:hypothetical protein